MYFSKSALHHFTAFGQNRARNLQSEIIKYPNHADALRKKLNDVQEEDIMWNDKSKYLDVILSFDNVMDECEAELQSHGKTHTNN